MTNTQRAVWLTSFNLVIKNDDFSIDLAKEYADIVLAGYEEFLEANERLKKLKFQNTPARWCVAISDENNTISAAATTYFASKEYKNIQKLAQEEKSK